MNKKPITYEEWLATSGESEMLGSKVLITHAILRDRHSEVTDKIFRMIKTSFDNTLFDSGRKPVTIEIEPENDAEMRALEVNTMIDAIQGASIEEYANMSFAQAKFFYEQVRQWETKSLWQYLKWWVRRKF